MTTMFNAPAFFAAVDQVRMDRGLTFREVANASGVSASTLTRLRQGHEPNADGLAKLLVWMGATDLRPFVHGTPEPARRPILRLGRNNKQLIYSQSGADPATGDVLVAVAMLPQGAAVIVERLNRLADLEHADV